MPIDTINYRLSFNNYLPPTAEAIKKGLPLGVVLLNFILRRIDYDTGNQKRNNAEDAVSVG